MFNDKVVFTFITSLCDETFAHTYIAFVVPPWPIDKAPSCRLGGSEF